MLIILWTEQSRTEQSRAGRSIGRPQQSDEMHFGAELSTYPDRLQDASADAK